MNSETYSDKFYSYNSKYISNVLSLRPPQHDSLEAFARICDILSLAKKPADADDGFTTAISTRYENIFLR